MITVTHRSPTQWVLFSDLHLSHKTKDTCFKVLRFINKTCLKTGSRCLFLGDFWDHVYRRGTLPVDLLNEVVRFFKNEWQVHLRMIPGNHDYYDANLTEHGLEMFRDINNRIRVQDEPMITPEGMLILPYMKDASEIEQYIRDNDPKAIFGHFDVIGARMNNTKLSTKGCNKSIFTVPTYSGHYHSPSQHGNVTYIGSPYQVHLGEAGDKKSLKIVDYKTGELVKTVPIDIGMRHYKVNNLNELPPEVRAGDRVVYTCDVEPALEKELLNKGVFVESKVPYQTNRVARMTLSGIGPVEQLKKFVEQSSIVTRNVDNLLDMGGFRDILATKTKSNILSEPTHVSFDHMSIHNFGPFKGSHDVSFANGVNLVTGMYANNSNADSNGVGKSLYTAGAFLWVLTGKTDPRFGPSSNLVYDIISTDHSDAHVILNGTINGKDFVVTRNMVHMKNGKARRRSHELMFLLDKKNYSGNTIRMTQEQVNRKLFGMDTEDKLYDFLIRTVVWSQRSSPGFLDSGDSNSRQELKHLVDLDLWDQMDKEYKRIVKELKKYESMMERLPQTYSEEIHEYMEENELTVRHSEWESEHEKTLASNIEKRTALEQDQEKNQIQFMKLIKTFPNCGDFTDEKRSCLMRDDVRLTEKIKELKKNKHREPPHIAQERAHRKESNRLLREKMQNVKLMGNFCDVCESEISNEKLRDRMNDLQRQIQSYDDLDKEAKKYKKRIAKELKEASDEQYVIKRKLQIAQYQHENYTERKRIVTSMEKLEIKIEMEEATKNPYDAYMTFRAENVDRLREKMKKVKLEHEAAKKETKRISADQHIFSARWGIQSYLLDEATIRLQSMVNEIIGEDVFDVSVTEKQRLVKTFKCSPLSMMSGGEYQKLKVAIFLAYRRYLQEKRDWSCNLVIFDEPDTYVDASGVKQMMNMIKTEGKGKCTIVISHSNSMHRDMNLFDSHIQIERDHTGSRKRKRV